MQQEYYQIFETNKPLINKQFKTIKEARTSLTSLYQDIELISESLGFTVEKRLFNIPIRNVLGLRLTYADGSNTHVTYTIKQVKLTPQYTNF